MGPQGLSLHPDLFLTQSPFFHENRIINTIPDQEAFETGTKILYTEDLIRDHFSNTNNTLIEPYSAQGLRTRPIEDALSTNTFELTETYKPFIPMGKGGPKEKLTLRFNPSTLPKSQFSINEAEAQEICATFKDGGHFNLNPTKGASHFKKEQKNEQILLEAKIQPYVLQGDIYKIIRVTCMEIVEVKANETVYANFQKRTQTPFLSKDMKTDMQSWKGSSRASQTLGLTEEEIPEERLDLLKQMAEGVVVEDLVDAEKKERKFEFRKINLAVEDSRETSDKKKTTTKGKYSTKGHALNDIDVRNSLTGKGASSTKSYSHMDLKLIKILNDFFGQEKIRLITKMSIYGVYVIMISIFILAIVNYCFTQKSLKEINNG